MGGPNPAERLRASGIDAGKATAIMAPPEQLFIPPESHPLFDIRSKLPVNVELAKAIDRGKYRPQVCVRDDGDDPKLGHRRLTVIWGQMRDRATMLANEWRRERGDEPLRVELQVVQGNDQEMLLLRLEENGRRQNETASTLCHKFKQAQAANIDLALAAHRYGVTEEFAGQVLRFEQLTPRCRAGFDSGDLPMTVLGAFVDTVPEAQDALYDAIKAAGAKSTAEVKAVVTRERRKVRKAVVKRAKAMPAKQLVRAASAAEAWAVGHKRSVDAGIVPALLEYAAGKPERLRRDYRAVAQALEVKPAKSAGRRAS